MPARTATTDAVRGGATRLPRTRSERLPRTRSERLPRTRSERLPRTRAGRLGRSGAVAAAAAVALFAASALPAHASSGSAGSVATSIIAPTVRTQDYAVTAAVTTAGASRDGFTVEDAPAPPPVVTERSDAVHSPFPTKVRMSSGFGYRDAPCAACSSMHQGLDFNPGMGASVGAVASGTVRSVGWNGAWGYTVILDHEIDGRDVSTLYAHMIPGSSPLTAGEDVQVGDLVGKVGTSGVSTGAHLHLEVWMDGSLPIDPAAWLEQQTGEPL